MAAIWMALALVSFSLMAVAGREAGRSLPIVDLIFYRSAIAMVILIAVLRATGVSLNSHLTTDRPAMHVARSVVHFIGQAAWLFALTAIPLAQVFAIEFTAPLWVMLFAPVVLSEKLGPQRVLAAAAGFAGVLIVVRPGLSEITTGTWMAVVCAIAFAGAILTTKLLTRTEKPLTVLLYMIAIQTVIALVLTGAVPALPDARTWIWLVVIAAASLAAHFALISAYGYADAVIVAPMDFLRLPLIAAVGVMFYAETLDPFVLLGGAMIFAANLFNVWRETRQAGH